MKKVLLIGINLFILLVMAQWAYSQMPAAITIDPANATGWDEITLTIDATKACVPDGKQSITNAPKVRMHSAAFLYSNKDKWETDWGDPGVDWDKPPADGSMDFPELTDNGDDTYSITFTPGEFYGVEEGSTIIGITAVFNGGAGDWTYEAKDNGDDGCTDFRIPLTYSEPTPALYFKLDLTYQEELGNFDRDGGKAYVIVDDAEFEMEQLLVGILPDARFELTLTEADDGITADTEYSYIFKMDDTEETIDARTVTAKNYQINLVHFFDDIGKPVGDVNFIVDMRYAARAGKFNPATNYVDIAGTLNEWNGKDHHLVDGVIEGDTIYEILVEELSIADIIEYKFRINGSWHDDSSEFPGGGPARHATVLEGKTGLDARVAKSVWNNTIPGYVPVILRVNMGNEMLKGKFVAGKNFVDVAGTMNGWDGFWNDELIPVEAGDSVYITKPAAFAPVSGLVAGDTMGYKFRIDGSWDDDKSEFPDGGPDRKLPIKDTVGGVENMPDVVWFNDVPLAIEALKIRIEEVSFYPNPVTDVMYIENRVGMSELRITNLLGQQVVRMRLDNRRTYQLNTDNLERGIYILTVFGEKGFRGTAKFIKH